MASSLIIQYKVCAHVRPAQTAHEAELLSACVFSGSDEEEERRCLSVDASGATRIWKVATGETLLALNRPVGGGAQLRSDAALAPRIASHDLVASLSSACAYATPRAL